MTSALLFLALFAAAMWLLSRVDADLTRAPLAGPANSDDRDAARLAGDLRTREQCKIIAKRAATARLATGSR